ncbi:C6 transcription factor [Blastomyces gilchristii SLH14081]|uniref:C6 transcription factor n=1 Tax=Blastomyces gilchristii (strain SLH14081) TaxID=559298 RepID=A0A179UN35_BLAGS|nr:C6 transcription factor [Blastomyces gilchristii SLH14081]OAT09243.1 C6 transcription factor [Blastomyces gilchristii SLH14081]
MSVTTSPPPKGASKDYHSAPISTGARPYRSHKIRACDLCRKRKSRCTVDLPGESCLLCRVQGADCHYREGPIKPVGTRFYDPNTGDSGTPLSGSQTPQKRLRTHQSPGLSGVPTLADETPSPNRRSAPRSDSQADHSSPRAFGEPFGESVHIVGPVAAEDAQVIERFMPSESSKKRSDAKAPYNVYSNDPKKPILYTTVSRRRQGLRTTGIPGESQKEILEQILGPFKHDLVKIFLDRINSSFLIFDETSFLESNRTDNGSLPPALMCQVYAQSLIYWDQSRVLAPHPKPDIRYAVNLAVAALHEEFSAPGLSTLSASLIDLTGRPIFSMTGNAINSGRTVALSHSLGLNRDPSCWKLSRAEKHQRIRLWWGVLIHDRWASHGHGVPPQINKNQYDVPLPTVQVLIPQGSPSQQRIKSAECYIALCQLTETLGDLLPLIYGLQPKSQNETSKTLRKLRTNLDSWEDSLPEWLKSSPADSPTPVSGSSSLYLAWLTLKMLICRVELQEINNSDNPTNPEGRQYFQTECRRAAEDVVEFMISLKRSNFDEFWLPYSAYHLTSTATLLVRCALETSDSDIARSCLSKVDVLRDALYRARVEYDWDLADMCLDHCERILTKQPGITSDEAPGADQTNQPPDLAALPLPDNLTQNDIVNDMMSISGTFGTMDGFPFDMTGIWDVSGWQDDFG